MWLIWISNVEHLVLLDLKQQPQTSAAFMIFLYVIHHTICSTLWSLLASSELFIETPTDFSCRSFYPAILTKCLPIIAWQLSSLKQRLLFTRRSGAGSVGAAAASQSAQIGPSRVASMRYSFYLCDRVWSWVGESDEKRRRIEEGSGKLVS